MERRLGIMQSVEPVLENAIKTLQKVVDVRGMGKALIQLNSEEVKFELPKTKDEIARMTREEEEAYYGKMKDNLPKDWNKKPEDLTVEEAKNKEEADSAKAEGVKAIKDGEKKENDANVTALKEGKKEETKSDSKMGGKEGEEKKKEETVDDTKQAKEDEKKSALVEMRLLDVTQYGFE